jgi:hypothetical protein
MPPSSSKRVEGGVRIPFTLNCKEKCPQQSLVLKEKSQSGYYYPIGY